MKIKINEKLKDATGEDIQPDVTKPAMTLRDVCVSSILYPVADEDQAKKYGKWEIFKKLRDAKTEVELTVEDIAIIKTAIGKFQPPLIMGQCFDLIEKTK